MSHYTDGGSNSNSNNNSNNNNNNYNTNYSSYNQQQQQQQQQYDPYQQYNDPNLNPNPNSNQNQHQHQRRYNSNQQQQLQQQQQQQQQQPYDPYQQYTTNTNPTRPPTTATTNTNTCTTSQNYQHQQQQQPNHPQPHQQNQTTSLPASSSSSFLSYSERQQFEQSKPSELRTADVWMISGCDDHQTSADVSNISGLTQLPDVPSGLAGGACTAILLDVLHDYEEKIQLDTEACSFTDVLTSMRDKLRQKGFSQIPQLSSSKPIDMTTPFTIVPESCTGIRRAVIIGINYRGQRGELKGCHNDAFNMYNYIQDWYGFQDENVTVLVDDGDHTSPTKQNIVNAYHTVVRQSKSGDGHGTKVKDLNGDEDDGYDEALVPLDFNRRNVGVILDDDLYDLFVKGLPSGVHVVALMDCCHSGTVLDLPYIFKADGTYSQMEVDRKNSTASKLFDKLGGMILNSAVGGAKMGLMGNVLKQFLR